MKRLATIFLALCAVCALVPAANATFNGSLYLSNFVSHNVDSVVIVNGFVVAGSQKTLTHLDGADGLVCRQKNLELFVGGQLSNNVFRVNPTTGASSVLNTPNAAVVAGAFLTVFNNDESALYTTGLDNNGLGIVDFATGATVNKNITGTTTNTAAGVAFDPAGKLYVTDSPYEGGGKLYIVDQGTFAATAITGPLPSAHGLTFDKYTGHMFVVGGGWIQEFDLAAAPLLTPVRQWDVSLMVGLGVQAHLDQGWSDGKGNFFAASNAGPLLYLDLTAASPVPVTSGDLGLGTDDIAGCILERLPPPPDCNNTAKSWGFWKHACSDKGNPSALAPYFADIAATSHVFGPTGCFTPGCALLQTKFKGNHQGKAAQQYLALLLNLESGKISRACVVKCGGEKDGDDGDDDGDKGDDDDKDGKNGHGHKQGEGENGKDGVKLGGMRGTASIANEDDGKDDGEDDGGDKGEDCGGTNVVGAIIDEIEANLCTPGQSTSFYAHLGCLAECANTFAEKEGGDGDDEGEGIESSDAAKAGITSARSFLVERIGANPAHISQGGVNFRITTPGIGIVRLGIYDATGRLVAQPVRDRAISGVSSINWNGTTVRGSRAAAGTYFYRATQGGSVVKGRFLLLP